MAAAKSNEYDVRFEFDAPRFYDFQKADMDMTPADQWFRTAPDGPGVKPAGTVYL